jgi:hypothetical protein
MGCGAVPPPATPTAAPVQQPIQAAAADAEFQLVLKADGARHAAGAPITMTTELHYIGARPQLQLAGSGSGLVDVSLKQLDGPLAMDAGGSDVCAGYAIGPGAPIVNRYAKSGGWDPGDPNAAFYEAFFADPLLRLPHGRWRATARAAFFIGDCPGPEHRLNAVLDFVVE